MIDLLGPEVLLQAWYLYQISTEQTGRFTKHVADFRVFLLGLGTGGVVLDTDTRASHRSLLTLDESRWRRGRVRNVK